MTKLKQTYLSPETDLLVVRFEGAILQASYGAKGAAGNAIEDGYEYDL